MFNEGLGGYNNDVLNAEPSSKEAAQSLVEEIKNRAKGCISSRNFPEAVKLYTKAIELTTDNAPAKAILHANRSMCYLSMSNAPSALEDANVAVTTDASYIKGYYRQAMAHTALSNYRSAKESLEIGLKLKPDDKELRTQLEKVEANLRMAASSPTSTKSNKTSNGTTTNTTTSVSKPATKAPSASKAATVEKEDNEDNDEDLKALNLRGYKKTSDGRTTTFFNNELDEEAKKLIGNIAPKKLDADVIPTVTVTPEVGSAWNSAGTYEEKIVTPWVQETLAAKMSAISVHVAADKLIKLDAYTAQSVSGIDITVSDTEGVTGHAQITMLRGKKKHMCDFSMDIKWVLTIHTATEDQTVEGKLGLVDITADKEYEVSSVEVTHFNKKACTVSGLPGFAGNLFTTYVKKTDQSCGLQKMVHNALMAFCDEFKTK